MDITPLIRRIRATVDSHKIRDGVYCRWLWQNERGTRELGRNEYGCADAANILYTIGEFPEEPGERAAFIETLQDMQNPGTGLYSEKTHHTIHTTAHCLAALELFDATPLYPLRGLDPYRTREGLYALLDGLDWENNPWPMSHQGAGVYAALVNAREETPEWVRWYFDWMWENADPETGFWRAGVTRRCPLYNYMAGGFHYLFNHEHARMPLRYPERVIDSCLTMANAPDMHPHFGRGVNFIEVDWIYCLSRAMRQTPHRWAEGKEALRKFAAGYLAYLSALDTGKDDSFNDLHMLFGACCALAELQSALPGEIHTDRPLRLVLDRRPFI